MRGVRLVPFLLLIAGAVCIGDAVLRGAASVALFVVFPVVYGSSAELLLGILLLVAGFFSVPFAWAGGGDAWAEGEPPGAASPGGGNRVTTSGMLLIGPVPVFFGGWKNVSRKVRVIAAAVGALLLVGVILVVLFR